MSDRPALPDYLSVDSAPAGFAVKRPTWIAPLFLLVYAGACAALVPLLPALLSSYAAAVAAVVGTPDWKLVGDDASISFRPFMGLLLLVLGVFAAGSVGQRLALLVVSLSAYLVGVFLTDVAIASVGPPLPQPFEPEVGLVSGFLGLLVILGVLLALYRLPSPVRVATRLRRRRHLGVLALCGAGALVIMIALSLLRERYFDDVHLRFVGGLDSALVLYVLALVCLLFVAGKVSLRRRPESGPMLSVAFLVPCCNEEYCLAETIASLDAAARRYPGRCRLYVVENGSQDRTAEVAAEALEACIALRGEVLRSPVAGKGRALNWGLARITEDVVIRIDADTLVDASLLGQVIPWFWDPAVGGVGGLPLPKRTAPRWLYPLRIIEVRYGVTFLRFAQAAADAVMVMPGLIAAYRRDLLQELGGFGEGFNGEDADVTMRIGRLGYRIVTDPDVKVYTEVPVTVAHLREQRERWARGLWHMASRNLSSIWMRQGPRGVWVLPWSVLNGARRSFAIPILLCALIVELLDPAVFALREVSVIAGFIVGLQLLVIFVLLVTGRQFAVLPYVPLYLGFRMFRSYCAFETILSLRLSERPIRAARAAPFTPAVQRALTPLDFPTASLREPARPLLRRVADGATVVLAVAVAGGLAWVDNPSTRRDNGANSPALAAAGAPAPARAAAPQVQILAAVLHPATSSAGRQAHGGRVGVRLRVAGHVSRRLTHQRAVLLLDGEPLAYDRAQLAAADRLLRPIGSGAMVDARVRFELSAAITKRLVRAPRVWLGLANYTITVTLRMGPRSRGHAVAPARG